MARSSATRSATCSADAVNGRAHRRATVVACRRSRSSRESTSSTTWAVTAALVLVHGITERAPRWGGWSEHSRRRRYRVIAMDLRGHGESSKVAPYDLATMASDLGAVLAAEGRPKRPRRRPLARRGRGVRYAAGGPCRAVVNVDQPLALSGFKAALGQVEPLLRGDRRVRRGDNGDLRLDGRRARRGGTRTHRRASAIRPGGRARHLGRGAHGGSRSSMPWSTRSLGRSPCRTCRCTASIPAPTTRNG